MSFHGNNEFLIILFSVELKKVKPNRMGGIEIMTIIN